MNDLEISTLGGLEIRREGALVTGFNSRKVSALLVYLACTGRPHSRDVLADLLWDDLSQSRAMGNLRVVLHSLRQHLEPFVDSSRDTVALNLESSFWLDVAELQANLTAVREQEGLVSDAAALRVEGAVDVYQGDFLEGFHVRDCRGFEEWMRVEQERYRGLVVKTLHDLLAYRLDRGAYEAALRHARRLLELEPWGETAHRGVMRCLAYGGQRAAALAQYETCHRILEEELGVEPEPETTALYEQILAGEIAAPSTVIAPPPRHNLPPQDTPFLGREAVLAEITALLDDRDCRLLTLVGPGGSGKTRLALEAASRQLERYRDGVFFVSLAPLDAVESIVPAAAEAVGLAFDADVTEGMTFEPQQQLLHYLKGKQLLLVMDNYEHLLAGAGLVAQIVRATPEVKVLATSRSRLSVGGEHRYQIAGMLYPDAEAPAEEKHDTLQYSAVKLFLQGARRAKPGFEPTDEELEDIVSVCRLVKGMPLAIRLAAGWMDALTPSRIADEISRSLDFLETELRDVPERQRSIRAAFDHSWRLLTESERAVMGAASVFRGGFTPEAAQAVTEASLSELRRLVNKALLQFVPRSKAQTGQTAQEGRYQIHELLRQYADEKLTAAPGAAEMARDRHSAFYASALEQWGADLRGPRQQTAQMEITTDLENARLAWHWAVEHGRVERIGQATEGLGWFYLMSARYEEGESAFRTAAEALGKLAPTASAYERRVWARTLVWQGFFTRSAGHPELSGQLTRQSLALLEGSELSDLDTRAERAFSLFEMAFAIRSGGPEGAKPLFEESLALYQALGDRWMTARLLNNLGSCLGDMGDFGEAQQLAEESLALRRALDDKYGIANTLFVLGTLAGAQGDLEGSLRLAREGVALGREIGTIGGSNISGLGMLCVAIAERGDFSEAAVLARQALTLAEDAPHAPGIAFSLELRATALVHLGDYKEANALARRYLTAAQKFELRWAEAVSFFLQGRVALATAAYGEAQKLLRESAVVLTRIGHRNDLSVTLAHSAMAARGLGQSHQTRQDLCEALNIATELGAWLPLVSALAAASLLLADAGQAERAVELYALASRYDYVANSRWFEDVVGKHIAAVTAKLPPEVAAAAQERGRARDLSDTAAELLDELGG